MSHDYHLEQVKCDKEKKKKNCSEHNKTGMSPPIFTLKEKKRVKTFLSIINTIRYAPTIRIFILLCQLSIRATQLSSTSSQ